MIKKLKFKGITKTVKDYMARSNIGGFIVYNKKEDTIEYIDKFYNSASYQGCESYYADGSSYWDAHQELVKISEDKMYFICLQEEQNKEGTLTYSDYSKIIKDIVKKTLHMQA